MSIQTVLDCIHYWLVDHPTISAFKWQNGVTPGASLHFLLLSILTYLALTFLLSLSSHRHSFGPSPPSTTSLSSSSPSPCSLDAPSPPSPPPPRCTGSSASQPTTPRHVGPSSSGPTSSTSPKSSNSSTLSSSSLAAASDASRFSTCTTTRRS
uniref:Uncharacterized protein n=1 Tax=Opuntia streptacantha TaxID=393608 RepID=A0A7C8YWX8_OPUST